MQTRQVDLTINTFEHWSRFGFGICSWMRPYLKWPKVIEHYEQYKLFVGRRSLIMKPMGWHFFRAFKPADRKEAQYWVTRILETLENGQDRDWNYTYSPAFLRKILNYMPSDRLLGIHACTKQGPKRKEAYDVRVQNWSYNQLKDEKYGDADLFPLSDLCDDLGYEEEANHLRNPAMTHTYACPFLLKMSAK